MDFVFSLRQHITPYVLASELDIILRASETHSWDVEYVLFCCHCFFIFRSFFLHSSN
jgi:hypothetical protein